MNTTNAQLLKSVNELPLQSGIYKYFNRDGELIYVGKAKNLRNRVRSYFYTKLDKGSKTAALVAQIETLQIIETLSEFEALILEAELIKKHKPKYNIALKDDKSYLYIVIRSEDVDLNGKKVILPKLMAARKADLLENDTYFGPFPGSQNARYVIRTIRRILPYRDCSITKFDKYKKLGSPCLYGHLGLCQAPCIGRVSPKEYISDINKIKKLLSGKSHSLLRSWEKQMRYHSKNQRFEEAAKFRDSISKFNYVRQDFKSAGKYLDNPYLVQDTREQSLKELMTVIPSLKDLPRRIECYDISNISGKDSVGSMVVSIDGEITKREYRRFKVRSKATPDDFAMMEEVLTRRLRQDWDVPDLIVVDGGKGQVSAAIAAMTKLNVDIPLIGLAKKFETIVYFEDSEFVEIVLPRDNTGLQLLQRLRDEAHRFAQAYHHKLRLNSIKDSLKK